MLEPTRTARDQRIRKTTKEIVALLVRGGYADLEQRTHGVRLSAEDLRRTVQEYGRRLRMPPDEAFDALSIGEVKNADPKAWWIVCDMWTEEEGKSDLSLELTLIDDRDRMRVELDNLHVL